MNVVRDGVDLKEINKLRESAGLDPYKICLTCKIPKPMSEFHNNKARPDGKAAECKRCKAHWRDRYYKTERGRQYLRDYSKKPASIKARATYLERRKLLEAARTGGAKTCKQCGQLKMISEFRRLNTGRMGRRSACKACAGKTSYYLVQLIKANLGLKRSKISPELIELKRLDLMLQRITRQGGIYESCHTEVGRN